MSSPAIRPVSEEVTVLAEAGVSVHDGFPNAGFDGALTGLDITRLLVQRPSSTFFMRAQGDSGQEHGICHNDVMVIDRAAQPLDSDLVVWWRDGFNVSTAKVAVKLRLDTPIWGVVTATIRLRRPPEGFVGEPRGK